METVIDRLNHGDGTSEGAWRQCAELARLPHVKLHQLVPARARLIVVAPHPNDEVLPCGGLLAELQRCGGEVIVVAVTDGECSHPESKSWSPDRLRKQRPNETATALAHLGLAASIVWRLHIPDGEVSENLDLLTRRLRRLLLPADVMLTAWRMDGNPDHEACAAACRAAAGVSGPRVIETPIRAWRRSAPKNTQMPWERAARFDLSPAVQARKARAIAAFRSQIMPDPETHLPPILTAAALECFARPFEVFFSEPRPRAQSG